MCLESDSPLQQPVRCPCGFLFYGNPDFKLATDGKVSDIIIPQRKEMLATYFCYMVTTFLSPIFAYILLYNCFLQGS